MQVMLLADTNTGEAGKTKPASQNISVATIEQSATAFGGGVGSSIEPKAQNKRKPMLGRRERSTNCPDL